MSGNRISIEDFLPKYPNIHDTQYEELNPYQGENFQEVIYRKKEFYEKRLSRTEELPEGRGELLKHQSIISRFLSGHTPYDELLIAHEMGCVDPETPIPLYNGTVKEARSVKVGDVLIGDDGKPRNVTSLVNGCSHMYTVKQSNGDEYKVNGIHVLTLKFFPKKSWHEDIGAWSVQWFDRIAKKISRIVVQCDGSKKSRAEGRVRADKYAEDLLKDNVVEITVNDYNLLRETPRIS